MKMEVIKRDLYMADPNHGSQRGFLLGVSKQQGGTHHDTLRMGDVSDHDDELILLVNHHDGQPIRRQHVMAANGG